MDARMIVERPFSRRGLLAGTATLAAGALVGGMTGCAPATSEDAAVKRKDQSMADTSSAYQLNPQDDSFTACTTDFAALFQPIVFGGKEARNRFVKSAAGSYAVNEAASCRLLP